MRCAVCALLSNVVAVQQCALESRKFRRCVEFREPMNYIDCLIYDEKKLRLGRECDAVWNTRPCPFYFSSLIQFRQRETVTWMMMIINNVIVFGIHIVH